MATAPAGELAAAEMLAQLLTPILGLLALSGFELGQDAVSNGCQLRSSDRVFWVKEPIWIAGHKASSGYCLDVCFGPVLFNIWKL